VCRSSILSLGQAAPLIALLDDLGIPWLAFADGDDSGRKALRKIGRRIGRHVDRNSDEVVMLPNDEDFEWYLVGQELQPAMTRGIANQYGDDALVVYAKSAQICADDDEALVGFLRSSRGTYGAAVAAAIVSTETETGEPVIPERIAELLRRASRILGATQP